MGGEEKKALLEVEWGVEWGVDSGEVEREELGEMEREGFGGEIERACASFSLASRAAALVLDSYIICEKREERGEGGKEGRSWGR